MSRFKRKKVAKVAWEVRSNLAESSSGLKFRFQVWLRDGRVFCGLAARYQTRLVAEEHAAKLSFTAPRRRATHRFELRVRLVEGADWISILRATHSNPLQKEGEARLRRCGIHEWEVVSEVIADDPEEPQYFRHCGGVASALVLEGLY